MATSLYLNLDLYAGCRYPHARTHTGLLFFSRVSTSERKFEITAISKLVDEVKEEFKEVIEVKHAFIQAYGTDNRKNSNRESIIRLS